MNFKLISNILDFGYLGLVAILVVLCYKVIIDCNRCKRSFKQTLVLLFSFSILSILSGGIGYLWALKELESARTIESSLSILEQQIIEARDSHKLSIEPLESVIKNITESFSESLLNSTRKEHLEEIKEVESIISKQQERFNEELKIIRDTLEPFPLRE